MSEDKKNHKPPQNERTITLGDGKVIKITPEMQTIQIDKEKMVELEKGRKVQLADGRAINFGAGESTKIPSEKSTVKAAPTSEPIIQIVGADIRLRQENVQEILTAIPNWMIRFGNSLFCALLILLIFIAWFVKYPEVVSTAVTVINKYPDQKIVLNPTDEIDEVLVAKGDQVQKNEVLAVKKNNANYQDILRLQSSLNEVSLNSKSFDFPFYELPVLALGSVQAQFAQFENSFLRYKSNQDNIERLKKQIYQPTENYVNGNSVSSVNLFQQVIQDFQALKSEVNQWADDFLIKSDLIGEVAAINFEDGQSSVGNDPFLIINPTHPPLYVAQLQVPIFNSGKVKDAQAVLLKLNNYPEMEFGMLEGVISDAKFQEMEDDKGFLVEATMPKQLMTSYNKEIDFKGNLQGTADIIIEHSRLLEKFFSTIN